MATANLPIPPSETIVSRQVHVQSPRVLGDRPLYAVLMACMIGLCWLLFTQIHLFSASLDALAFREPTEAFISVSRLGASLVIILLLKEVFVAIRSLGTLMEPQGPALPAFDPAKAPMVSVIVPAFNEANCIENTLASLVALDYPTLEIVMVDDGSTDDTLALARSFAERHKARDIRVITQANAGKWKALNEGIRHSKGELVLCVDADSSISIDALKLMVPHFDDGEVGAVSGQVQVGNQINLVTRLQALEYLVANGSARTAQSGDGCVLIVPGPIGLFRRSSLEAVCRNFFDGTDCPGPFSPHTFAEDFELSVMLCAQGNRILYEPKAVALTRAPQTMAGLLNQRYRWLRGSMQVGERYRRKDWTKITQSKATRWWMSLTTIGDLYVVPLAGLMLMATLVWTLMVSDLKDMLFLWMLIWLIHMCAAAVFIRAHGEHWRLCLLVPLQTIYGSVLLTGAWTHAVIDHIGRKPMKW